MEQFKQLVQIFGLPAAMLIVMLWLLGTKKLVWWWNTVELLEARDKLIILKDQRIGELEGEVKCTKTDCDKYVEVLKIEHGEYADRLREEKNYWRELALKGYEQLRKATTIAEKAVDKIPNLPEGE